MDANEAAETALAQVYETFRRRPDDAADAEVAAQLSKKLRDWETLDADRAETQAKWEAERTPLDPPF